MSSSFFNSLQGASWRGVPFAVTRSTLRAGRRTATHEYPFRDDVWVEDLGRLGRRIQLHGFLVENGAYLGSAASGGSSVLDQRTKLIQACEQPGADDLVHPSLGRLKVSLLDFEVSESVEKGGVFEIRFTFMAAGQQEFPTSKVATQQQTALSGVAAFAAAAQDFMNKVSGLMALPPFIGEIQRTAAGFLVSVTAIVGRATSLIAMVTNLPGQFGRYVGQYSALGPSLRTSTASLVGAAGQAASAGAAAGAAAGTVSQSEQALTALVGAGAQSRQAVASQGAALTVAAASADAPAIAAAAQATVQALQVANPDPMASIRALLALQASMSPQARSSANLVIANTASVNLYRRCAVVAAAMSTGSIKLSSADEATTTLSLVCAALDQEIQEAGDGGESASYTALRSLRVAVVQDLRARAATLAGTQLVRMPRPLPLLVTAQRLYQDAGRYDDLLQAAQPIHPAFPPTQFRALSQ